MRVVHHPDAGEPSILAEDVRIADGFLSRSIGLMGRAPLEDGEAMAFRFDGVDGRQIHTMFVRAPIDVIWIIAERVETVETFDPWSIGATKRADTVLELPSGAAEAVDPGDVVRLEHDPD